MRRIPLRFVALSVAFLLLNAAGLLWIRHELLNRPRPADAPLRIVQRLPETTQDDAERLSIVFDRDVGEPARLNEAVAGSPPFRFTPDVAGHWEWSTPRRLEFVLAAPLPPGRSFDVVPAAGLETQLGQVVQVDAELEIQTRPLEFVSASVVAADRSDVTIELKFNQPVAPDALLQHLQLTDPESSSDAASETSNADENAAKPGRLTAMSLINEPADRLVIRCPRPQAGEVLLQIAPELTGAEGTRPLAASIARTLKLPPVFAFLRADVESRGLSEFWQIDLLFLPGLTGDQDLPRLTVEPPVEDLTVSLDSTWRSDGRVVRLRGRFESSRRYRTTLPASLLSVEGKPLGEDVAVSFDIPDRAPQVSFPAGRGQLSPRGNFDIELSTVNVGSVRVSAQRVHRNNLVNHLQGAGSYRTARAIGDRLLTMPVERNRTQTHVLSLRETLSSMTNDSALPLAGVFQIQADATDQSWTRDWVILNVSDLGLTLRQGPCEVFAWVMSLSTGEPVAGAAVTALSYSNQELATATTDEFGRASLPVDPKHPDGRAWVIVAEAGDQLAWLETDESHAVFDDVDTSGRPVPRGLDLLLYTDRGAYRPGETIHLAGLLRDDLGQVPPEFPLQLHIVRPDGREVATELLRSQPEVVADNSDGTVATPQRPPGTFHHAFTPGQTAATGPWLFRVTLPDDEEVIAQSHVYVEEFVPVRLEVTARASSQLATSLDDASVDINGRYLFGAPASELPVQLFARLVPDRFRSTDHPDFVFGPLKLDGEQPQVELSGRLDSAGHATLPLAPTDATASGSASQTRPGRWNVSAHVTVSEEGGRSVSAADQLTIDTQNHHLGLRSATGPIVKAGEDVRIDWLQLDAHQQPAAFQIFDVELLRVDHETVTRRVNGRVVWESLEKVTSVSQQAIETESDESYFSVRCKQPGLHRLVATIRDSGQQTELELRSTDSDGAGLNLAAATPEQVKLTLNQTQYRPGETAQLLLESPFLGQALVTLESDRVLWSSVVRLAGLSQTIDVPVPESLRGGAFVSVAVQRALDPAADTWQPVRAHGLTRLQTVHADAILNVVLTAPTQAAPESTVDVSVQTAPHAAVHLWAVDEGILATTGYRTPDPYGHFFGPRRHETIASDTFSELLPDFQRPASLQRIGGDGDSEESLRRNPVPTKLAAPAVVWREFATADSNGQLTASVKLPNFTGELRWMVVAATDQQFGSAEHAMTVTAPLLIETPWPRFAAPGDHFRIPARVFNSTDAAFTGTVSFEASPGLAITLPEATVSVPPHDSSIVWLDVVAVDVGLATGIVRTGSDTLSAKADFAVAVRPATPLISDRSLQTLASTESTTLTHSPRVRPQNSRSTVTISSGQTLELKPALQRLLDYPYGCVEQTSSQLRGLLAAAELLQSDESSGSGGQRDAAKSLIAAGVTRLWAMQSRGGGFSYWPGQSSTHVWGSAYAGETLALARQRGFEVDDRLLLPLRQYLGQVVRRSDDDGPDANTRADLCLTLARLGEPPVGWMSVLSERLEDLDMAGRASLALAWLEAGRRDRALAALPDDTISLTPASSFAGRFSSDVTQRAKLLATLLQLDPQHEWVPQLRQQIEQARGNGTWSSTLDNAVVIEALTAAEKLDPTQPFTGKVTIGNQTIDLTPGTTRTIDLAADFASAEPATKLAVSTDGDGEISLLLETTGLALAPPDEHDRGIRVRRRWLDRQGDDVDPSGIRIGDLLQVEVTLQATGRTVIPNVAIVDALPTGLEVENPRLATSDNSVASDSADHVQFLDDRIVIFGTASRQPRTFRYALRAITAADAQVPPVQASCMYDESISSLHGAGLIRIEATSRYEEPARLATRPDETAKPAEAAR